MNETSSPVYKTPDTATAAYLCCCNFKLVRMEVEADPNNHSHTVFVFDGPYTLLKQAEHEFEIGTAVGNITSFFRQYRRLLREVKEKQA